MNDRARESHDSLDDSWFESEKKPRRAITRAEVFAALEEAGLETDVAESSTAWDGLDDSWFDRKPGKR